MTKNFTHFQEITKSELVDIFLKHILNRQALELFDKLKQAHAYPTYQQKAGQYIFDRIATHFASDIRVTGLTYLRQHTPCLIAYPHKASILDGTLLNVLLLKEEFNAKAIARVSTDAEKDSLRDHAYKMLSDFIIPLKQQKSGNEYLPIKYKDMLRALRNVYAHYNDNGVVLIAPEGKTNPYHMMQAKESLAGLSGKGRVPIIPCTIEYHQPLSGQSQAGHCGGVYHSITIEFHEAVRVDRRKKDDAGTLNAVMAAIASGYTCRFKGGCYQPRRKVDPFQPEALWIRHLERFDEKFDPIYRYVHSVKGLPDQKEGILLELLEQEFDICLACVDRRTDRCRHLPVGVTSVSGIKQAVKGVLAQKIRRQRNLFSPLPHMVLNAPRATAPMAASARCQV